MGSTSALTTTVISMLTHIQVNNSPTYTLWPHVAWETGFLQIAACQAKPRVYGKDSLNAV